MKLYRIVTTVVLLVTLVLAALGQSDNDTPADAPAGSWSAPDMQGLKIN